MNITKISVIVPVYNVEKYLHKCVDSLLAQTFTDFEILLIDDGSPDSSGEICDEYAHKDIRIRVFHKKNGGVSSARNFGIDNASGSYITFIDADDWIKPFYLEHLIKNLSVSLVISGVEKFGCINDVIKPESNKLIEIKKDLNTEWLESPYFSLYQYPVGKLFDLEIIRENNIYFNTGMFYSEDFCFVLDYMSCIEKFMFISEANYMYYLPDLNRKGKYKMNFEQLKTHYSIQKKAINKLEEKCECNFINIHNEVNSRFINHFFCYINNLNSSAEFIEEARKFRKEPLFKGLLKQTSFSFRSLLYRALLIYYPKLSFKLGLTKLRQ